MDKTTRYLAIDLGASHSRVILGTLHAEKFDIEIIHRFTTPLIEENNHLFWDIDLIRDELQKGLEKALDSTDNLLSISVSSWGVDYVPLDANGRALRKPYSYRDGRTRSILDEVHARISEVAFYRKTGIKSMPINTLYQVYHDSRYEPDIFRNTVARLTIADYFNYLFSGKKVVEKSLASTTQMLDMKKNRWATDLLEQLELLDGAWPEIVPSGTILGNVKNHPFLQTIASCSHDTACAVATVSAINSRPQRAFLSSGTWSLIGVERSTPILTDQALHAGFTNESGPGDSIRFLKNLTGLWVLQECEKEWKKLGQSYTYEQLMDEAGSFAESGPVPLVDLNEPQFGEPGNMISKLLACCEKGPLPIPQSRGAQVATILKSLANSYAETINELNHITGENIGIIHIVGGGSQNRLLCKWTADLSGCKVLAGPVEATAIGNIILQAQALGSLPAGKTWRTLFHNFANLATYFPDKNQ